jgi:diguanylate cyclase (GGDEF)-like protein
MHPERSRDLYQKALGMDTHGLSTPSNRFVASWSAFLSTFLSAFLSAPLVVFVYAIASVTVVAPVLAQPNDQAEARVLLAQAERAYESDLRRSAVLSERALALSSHGGDRRLEQKIAAHLCMSLTGFAADRARAMAEARIRIAEQENDLLGQAVFLTCKAYSVEAAGDLEAASGLYEHAMDAAKASGDRKAIASVYAYRGENRHYQGRYDEALSDLGRAFALYSVVDDKVGRRYTLNAMANLYSDAQVGEFDKAIEYYRELLVSEEAAGAKGAIATTLFNIASAYEEKGDYDASLRDFQRALALDREIGEHESVAEGERAVGRVLLAQGRPQEALPMIDRALAYFVEKGNADAQGRTRITRAHALRKLGRLDEAMRAIDLSLAHFGERDNWRYLVSVRRERAEILAARGEWRAAYTEAQELRTVEARLEKGLMKERTSRLRVQFDAARKEEQNAALRADNQRRVAELNSARHARNLQWLVILIGAALLAVFGIMAFQQLRKNRRMRSLAMTDDLTGLPNRRHILEYLDEQRKASVDGDAPLALIAFDIDHFKRINDVHGHAGGDRVLASVSRIIAPHLRSSDRLGRVGGEEFLVVLPDTSLPDAHMVAERLRTIIESTALEGLPNDLRMTASFGVAKRLINDDAKTILKRADDALYRAKREGRNRVVVG